MFKKFVKINELTTTTCNLTMFHKNEMDEKVGWNPYQTPLQNLSKYMGSSLKLRYTEAVVDDLIENIDHICEVDIEKGYIKKVKPLMSFNELLVQLEAQYEGEIESSLDTIAPLDMKLKTVLRVISEMEHISDMVNDGDLFEALMDDHSIKRDEAARLIGTLMRNGSIYSPRPGYYKKTL